MPKGVGNWVRGRAASELRPGIFIRDHLQSVGEDFIANMHRAYKGGIKRRNERRPKGQKLRAPTYNSFKQYAWLLAQLGLIEFTREEETESLASKNLETRHYFKLTKKGEEEHETWLDPLKFKFREIGK